MPVAVLVGSSIYYVHTDQLGTPRIITEGNTAIWRWESGPFGEEAAQEDPDGDQTDFTYNLRYPGQYYDFETGFHYNYFRTYDPATGRYYESDTIGLDGGLNTYAYVEGNPLAYADPTGEAAGIFELNTLLPMLRNRGGGPWSPPSGVGFKCRYFDSCKTIERKMYLITKMIKSHQGWDWHVPPPRGGGRHAKEIAELWRAYAKCQNLYMRKKCGPYCEKEPVQNIEYSPQPNSIPWWILIPLLLPPPGLPG